MLYAPFVLVTLGRLAEQAVEDLVGGAKTGGMVGLAIGGSSETFGENLDRAVQRTEERRVGFLLALFPLGSASGVSSVRTLAPRRGSRVIVDLVIAGLLTRH